MKMTGRAERKIKDEKDGEKGKEDRDGSRGRYKRGRKKNEGEGEEEKSVFEKTDSCS